MSGNVLFEKYGQTIAAGKQIFREGEDGDKMYIIQDGAVRISRTIDGKEHVLAELTKGDFFGEMAIVSRIKRTATATTIEPAHLLAFDRAGFQSMIEKNARIAMNVIDKLCRRLENANSQIQSLVRKNEQSVIALNLYNRFMEKPENERALAFDRSVKEISMSLQIPLDTVESAVRALAEDGILSVKSNALRLRNENRLTEVAEKAGGGA
ncbi:MAG: Crp/Fnr family transcriptional regulator [Spirochaetaceae bacterium]|nr:MAG: Crp/Fnr family transcriptional regulator [Spirochaetaceae bacterium]